MNPFRILIVDDDLDWVRDFRDLLEDTTLKDLGAKGCNRLEIDHAADQEHADKALEKAGPLGYNLVLLDLDYPGLPDAPPAEENDLDFQGMRYLPELRRLLPHAAIVIITSYPYERDLNNAVKAIRDHHANDYVPKATPFEHIVARIAIACEHVRHIRKLVILEEEYHGIVRSLSSRVFAEDGSALLDCAKRPLFEIADDIASGDVSSIQAAPDKIRALYRTLHQDYFALIKVLFDDRDPCHEVDVADLLRELVELYERRIEDARTRVQLPPKLHHVKVSTYESDLKVALHEILSNALDALEQSTRTPVIDRLLEVSVQESGDEIVIRIADNGDGIPDDVMQNMDRLGKIKRKDDRHRGIGLYIAKRMMGAIGGDLIARNKDEGGAEILLTLRGLPEA